MDFTIYTDGGCQVNNGKGCVGAYAYIILNALGKPIIKNGSKQDNTTNNQMEMMAAIKALENVRDILKSAAQITTDYEVLIRTDSKYLVSGIRSNWKSKGWKTNRGKPVLNKDLWKSFDKVMPEFKKCKFEWVKGHDESKYNVMADKLVHKYLYR